MPRRARDFRAQCLFQGMTEQRNVVLKELIQRNVVDLPTERRHAREDTGPCQ